MKILVIQNRVGIGDTIIFLPYIKALYKKYNSPISLLVKANSKADQYLDQTKYIDKIIILDRNAKSKNRHSGLIGIFNLIRDLKKHNFDKIFIFNSSLRFNLIARFSKIPEIYQYPLFTKNQQHITNVPKKFLKKKLNLEVNEDPDIQINNESISEAIQKFKINKDEFNVLLGIGGSGPTKRIPAKTYLSVIDKVLQKHRKNWRLTLDTIEDYIVIKKFINHIKLEGKLEKYGLDDIVDFFNDNLEILEINKTSKSKKLEKDINTRMDWRKLKDIKND